MLWKTAVVLIILWLLALGSGFSMGEFVHVFCIVAIALLVAALSQEVVIHRRLKRASRRRVGGVDVERFV